MERVRNIKGYIIDKNDLSQILTVGALVNKFYYKLPDDRGKIIGGKKDWRILFYKGKGEYKVSSWRFKSRKRAKEYLDKYKFFYSFGANSNHLIYHTDLVDCTLEWFDLKKVSC